MTKTNLITNIEDFIERSYYSDDMTDELYNQMSNYIHAQYINARVEEETSDKANIDDVRNYYCNIVENFLSINATEGFVPYYDNAEEIEYKLTFDGNETMKVDLFIANSDNSIIQDYIIVDDFLPIKDKIDAIVGMIMFDKYC